MTAKDLDTRFQEAVDIATAMSQSDLPQDVQLRLYAYYKQATIGTPAANFNSNFDLRMLSKPMPGCKSAICLLMKQKNYTSKRFIPFQKNKL